MAKNYCLSFQFDWFYFFFLGDGQWENGKERRPTAGEVTPARHNGAGEKKTNISAENCEILLPFCDLVSVYRTPTR